MNETLADKFDLFFKKADFDKEIVTEKKLAFFMGLPSEEDEFITFVEHAESIGRIFSPTKNEFRLSKENFTLKEQKDFDIHLNKYYSMMEELYGNLDDIKEEVLTLIAFRKPREATEKIMEVFLEKNHIYSTRDDERSEMWIYHEGIYIPQGKTFINEFCAKVLGKIYTTSKANEVVEKIRVRTYIDQEEFFKTNYIDEVPILDGILNIKNRKISPFTPEKIFFSKLPLNYKPDQKCDKIKQFFKDILVEEEDIKVIFEIFGFLLLKEYLIEKAIMFNGEGRNGKGKTLLLMEKFVGSANVCNVGIASMQKDNFDLEDLFGKLINVGGDTGETALKDTGCFKELTGRDGVNLKRKFKRTLRFVNYAKHVFACNDLPMVYDNSVGFWSRWVLIDFPYEFKTKEEIDKLPKDERKNKKIINLNILNEISTQEELNGLLNEALDGLDRILKNSDFSNSKGTNYIKQTWKRRANSFLAFCEDCVEESEDDFIIKIKLKKEYGKYCKEHNIKNKVGDKTIKNTLENNYFVEEVRDLDRNYLWKGIKLKNIPMIPTLNDPIDEIKINPIGKNTIGKVGSEEPSQRDLLDKKPKVVKIGTKKDEK